jgi:hypothetical protein
MPVILKPHFVSHSLIPCLHYESGKIKNQLDKRGIFMKFERFIWGKPAYEESLTADLKLLIKRYLNSAIFTRPGGHSGTAEKEL